MKNLLLAGVVLSTTLVSAVSAGEEVQKCKFVAFGWEMQGDLTPEKLKENQPELAKTGLAGVGIYLPPYFSASNPSNRLRSVMSDTFLWQRNDFGVSPAAYRETLKLPGLQHSFLKTFFHHPTNRLDWADDTTWKRIAQNMRTAAWFAKESGFVGLCVDHEDYKHARQFTWTPGDGPYATVAALARRRAGELFKGVFEEFPDVVLLFYWFLTENSAYFSTPDAFALAEARGDLWPAFANGILDVAPFTARIVDGNEQAYSYESRKGDFRRSSVEQRDRAIAAVAPENRAKFRALLRVGFGLYMDMYVNPKGSRWYFGPAENTRLCPFDRNATAAAAAASEYVWLWGEKRPWIRWKPSFPQWLAKDGTWVDKLPGLPDVLFAISDPESYAERRCSELEAKKSLHNLLWNGNCKPNAKDGNLPPGFTGDGDGKGMPPPFYFWRNSKLRHGKAGIDIGGGIDGGNALRLEGVESGCVMYHVPGNVKREGDMLAFEVMVKGRASIRLAKRHVAVGGDPSQWRRFRGLLRIGEGNPNTVVNLCVSQAEGESTWFANVRMYRVFRYEPTEDWTPGERWRGFNLQDAHWQKGWIEYDEDDFAFMKEFGFNFARLPLSYRRWLKNPDDWESIDPSKLSFLDRAVELGRKYGIHVMINLHRAPGYTVAGGKPEPASLWTSPEAERVFLKHWKFIAERYRNVPEDMLSFNPVNEPPGDLDETVYARVMTNVTAAIRAISPKRLVVVDGLGGDRHPCAALYGARNIGQATRGYVPEAVSQWKPVRNGVAQPPPEWPRSGTAPAGVIAGPCKAHLRRPLELLCVGPGMFTIWPGRVSADCTVVAKSGGREISRIVLSPKDGDSKWRDVNFLARWNLTQGTYCGEWRFALPEGASGVLITCEKGDWLDLQRIEYASADGTKRVELPFYHHFAPPVNFRQSLKGWAGEVKGFFPVDGKGSWEPVRYRDPGKEYLYRHVMKAWDETLAKGVFAFCGEMGPLNGTPHNVQLALLEDYLQLFKERNMGWAVWQLRGETGVMDSNRKDVEYEDWRGHKLDREMLDLLRRY